MFRTHEVKQGDHRFSKTGFFRPIFWKNSVSRSFMFLDSYGHFGNLHLKEQINKLFGISYLHPHLCSFRIGFRWNEQKGEYDLFQYQYVGWKNRKERYLASVPLGKLFDVKITNEKDHWLVVFDGVNANSKTFKFEHSIPWYIKPFGFLNLPYFGGSVPAPHEIKIKSKN